MALDRIPVEVYLTLEDDFHDFDTLEVILEPLSNSMALEDHIDNPNEKFRYKILDALRDKNMWKASLNNPEGPPYKVRLGSATINTDQNEITLDLEKTSHFSVDSHDLVPRTT